MRLGYVVLHYVFEELTLECLGSLSERAPRSPVLVVDNGSQVPFVPDQPVLRLPENLSLAAAMNRGSDAMFASEDVDVVVQLNNDIVVTPSTDRELAWAFEAHPSIGVAAPLMDQKDAGFMYHPCPHQPGPDADAYLDRTLQSRSIELVPYVDNAAFAIRRSAWDTIGGLEERFTGASWGANYDYCWRARQARWQTCLVRSAFVHHRHRGTWGQLDPEYSTRASQRMMTELRLVWGDLADEVSCRDLVRRERQMVTKGE